LSQDDLPEKPLLFELREIDGNYGLQPAMEEASISVLCQLCFRRNSIHAFGSQDLSFNKPDTTVSAFYISDELLII